MRRSEDPCRCKRVHVRSVFNLFRVASLTRHVPLINCGRVVNVQLFKSNPFCLEHIPQPSLLITQSILASRHFAKITTRTALRLFSMAPKQQTLGYVKPSQTTLGCVVEDHTPIRCVVQVIFWLTIDAEAFLASPMAPSPLPRSRRSSPLRRRLLERPPSLRPRWRTLKTMMMSWRRRRSRSHLVREARGVRVRRRMQSLSKVSEVVEQYALKS